MAWFMGIDIGLTTSKGVITENDSLLVHHELPSGDNYQTTAQKLRDELLARAGLRVDDIAGTITTGHGSDIIPFKSQYVADIQCCAKGINHIFPSVRTVIDVQAQSSQVIQLDNKGQITDYAVNESCAGGGGCFLEIIANVLQLKLEDIGPLSLKSKSPVVFTTACAVFGESEAISRVAEGIAKEDILAGVHDSLAGRIFTLIDRIGLKQPCAISGGGALNIGLIKRIEERGFLQVLVPPQPLLVNALGAAIIASK